MEFFGASSLNGFNARVIAQGAEAAYFNPGLLTRVNPTFQLGFFVAGEELEIGLMERPPGSDVSSAIYNAWTVAEDGTTSPLKQRPLPTTELAPRQMRINGGGAVRGYATLGLVKPLIDDRLVLGFHLSLPMDALQRTEAHYSDEREQFFTNRLHFELMGDRLSSMSLAVALGSAFTDWFSLGVGFTMGLSSSATSPVYVPDALDQTEILMSTEVTVGMRFAPHFGLWLRPMNKLQLTATLHLESLSETEGQNAIKFWNYDYAANGNSVAQAFRFVSDYEPVMLSVGAAWDLADSEDFGLVLMSHTLWSGWSQYLDRHGEVPEPGWKDTFSGALGAKFRFVDLFASLDLALIPSPVPEQTGRSNYVDNDRLAFSVAFSRVFQVLGTSVHATLHLQGHRVFPREAVKAADGANPVVDEFPDNTVDVFADGAAIPEAAGLQTNNPGYPGFHSEG